MPLAPFLTSYDPSDLPGNSIDPLGFERGYLLLAEKILPGMTNVASEPRYFAVLCMGAHLAGDVSGATPRKQYKARLERVLRLERFWALANVLASQEQNDDEHEELPTHGLRGIVRTREKIEALHEHGADRTDAHFQLLSRQQRYGAVGIYGVVAERMRFWDGKVLGLTPDLGDRLAEAFADETGLPREVRRAVTDDGEVRLSTLEEWGRRAHLSAEPGHHESRCVADAAYRDPTRARMLESLEAHPYLGDDEEELDRLRRLTTEMEGDDEREDLREGLTAIVPYERSYKWALLAFERLLFRCRNAPSGTVSPQELQQDPVLELCRDELPKAVDDLDSSLQSGHTTAFRDGLERLHDVELFLQHLRHSATRTSDFVSGLLERHADVQRGKFDRGRPKMPWIEERAGRLSLTMTKVGGLGREPTSPDQIEPHPYRLASADALIDAASASAAAT